MTEKERKKLCWPELKRKKQLQTQQMVNKSTKIEQRKQHENYKNVDKYYQKVNIGYNEKPKVIFRKLWPSV